MIRTRLPSWTRRPTGDGPLGLHGRPPQPSLPVLALLAAAIVMASVGVAVVVSLAMPTVYGAQADLLIRPGGDASGFGAERDLATQQAILQGSAVLQPVADAAGVPLGRLEKMISVENPAPTNILRLTVASQDRGTAQRLAELITRSTCGAPPRPVTATPTRSRDSWNGRPTRCRGRFPRRWTGWSRWPARNARGPPPPSSSGCGPPPPRRWSAWGLSRTSSRR